ncbi:MAG TPA: cytochrome c oxidase subunit 3 [Pyrinomonadaceae bacterium]|nr:cytochrome c oxidase subunit 3 [Pyrinomonadaceae bacterium]
MKRRPGIDVSDLPQFAFGSRGLIWWGVWGFLAIETTMLVICLVSYFYLQDRATDWPPPPTQLPDLGVPTATLAVLLLSVVPMHLLERAARRLDTRRTILWTLVCIALGVVFCVLRGFEFYSLNVMFDSNAYGSVVWTIIGVHSFHLVAEVIETCVLAAVLLAGHTEPKYFVDSTDNALYWYFIVAIWIPCYAVLYLAPRFL